MPAAQRPKKYGAIFFAILLAGLPCARAQLLYPINPAATQDARVLFYNAAALSAMPTQTYFGLQLLYPGAIPGNTFAVKASQFALSWPEVAGSPFMLGAHARHLGAPLYSEGRYGLALAYRFAGAITLGADLALLTKAYDREKFNLEHPDDPVFRGGDARAVFDPALSLYSRLSEKLALAASVFHLNQPNVALAGTAYRLPVEALAGATFTHRFARFDAGMQYRRQEWRPTLGAEVFSNQLGRVRLGYGYEQAVFEGQLRVQTNTSLFYSFKAATNDLGPVSAGSHEFGLIFVLPWRQAQETQNETPAFLLQALPPSQVVLPGDTPLYQLTLVRRSDWRARIHLEAAELPPHLLPRFSQNELSENATVILALESAGDLLPGDYPFIVTARSGGQVQHLPLHLRVNPLPRLLPEIFTTVDSVIVLEVRHVLEELPMIPRVFFPSQESKIAASRYDVLSPAQNVFDPANVREINTAYRNLLNIVAARLKHNPAAVITLTGFSSGPRFESNWRELAEARAQAVHDYLVDSVGVAAAQIVRLAPLQPGRRLPANNTALQEEWQRVLLAAPAPFESELLAPLHIERKEVEALPQRCGFVNKYSLAEVGVAEWRIAILNSAGDTVQVLAGKEALPDTVYWEWHHALIKPEAAFDPAGDQNAPALEQEGYFSLWLKDRLGQVAVSPVKKMSVRRRRISHEVGVERIPIFLFGFGEAQLGSFSGPLRKKLMAIAEKLERDPRATCFLKGHTDAIGDQLSNRWLSVRRAKTVFDLLVSFGIEAQRLAYVGVGEEEPLADNRLPEGRIMNRRVEVYIRHSPEWMQNTSTTLR